MQANACRNVSPCKFNTFYSRTKQNDYFIKITKIIASKHSCSAKKYYLCTADTRYRLTQIINH